VSPLHSFDFACICKPPKNLSKRLWFKSRKKPWGSRLNIILYIRSREGAPFLKARKGGAHILHEARHGAVQEIQTRTFVFLVILCHLFLAVINHKRELLGEVGPDRRKVGENHVICLNAASMLLRFPQRIIGDLPKTQDFRLMEVARLFQFVFALHGE